MMVERQCLINASHLDAEGRRSCGGFAAA